MPDLVTVLSPKDLQRNQVTKEQIDAEYAKLAQEYELVQGDNSKEKYEHAVRYQLRDYVDLRCNLP